MNEAKQGPDAEALFTAIEYAVLRKMNGYDRGELQAHKSTLLMHMRERAELLEALQELTTRAQKVKVMLDAELPEGAPVHPASAQLTWPLSSALGAIARATGAAQ